MRGCSCRLGRLNDRATAIPAGTDLEMPPTGQFGVDQILEGVKSGMIAESDLNRAVGKLLDLIDKVRGEHEPEKTWQAADFNAVAKKVVARSYPRFCLKKCAGYSAAFSRFECSGGDRPRSVAEKTRNTHQVVWAAAA